MRAKTIAGISALFLCVFLAGCISSGYPSRDTSQIQPSTITSFQTIPNATICTEGGKPIIRLYSTSICPHCQWVSPTINGVMNEYVAEGKIVAHHFDVDTGDDQITKTKEPFVPKAEADVFLKFNPQQSVPTYVFGCKYWRIGNAFEVQNKPDDEAAEFKAVIEKLLSETANTTAPASPSSTQ